ncbi:hypothetical protein FACS189451_04640 [Bacteroidia bacterium]|nr:hypothetical protein FACS189451_04640 [Bacteroidia bacterium]
MAKVKDPIQEAERYLDNARTILSEKAGKDGKYYTDSKYVKMAGHTAWCGVLVALDAVFGMNEKKKSGQCLDFKDYQEAMAQRDKKMSRTLLGAYESLHKSMGYDGNPVYSIVQTSLREGKSIIDWAGKNYRNN